MEITLLPIFYEFSSNFVVALKKMKSFMLFPFSFGVLLKSVCTFIFLFSVRTYYTSNCKDLISSFRADQTLFLYFIVTSEFTK